MRYLMFLIMCCSLWAAPRKGCNTTGTGTACVIEYREAVPGLPDRNELVRIAWMTALTHKDLVQEAAKDKNFPQPTRPDLKMRDDALFILQVVLQWEPKHKMALELLEYCKKNQYPPEKSSTGVVIRKRTKQYPNGVMRNGMVMHTLQHLMMYHLITTPNRRSKFMSALSLMYAKLYPWDPLGKQALEILKKNRCPTDPRQVFFGPSKDVYECTRFVYIDSKFKG